MPKIVDHELRRRQLADAAWRVISRDGLEAASVRNIAKEAGISLGSLRYYFASQDDLLAFALKRVGDRIRERIGNLQLTEDVRTNIEAIIGQTLPLDDERKTEAVIWLAFLGKALTNAGLGNLAAQTHQELYGLYLKMIETLQRHAMLPQDADIELEARRLHALIDGLALHGASGNDGITGDTIRKIVAHHLSSLAAGSKPR